MKLRARIVAACAILAAFAAGPSLAAPASPALTSFGVTLSSSDLAALAVHTPAAAAQSRLQPPSFAASLPLTQTFALDSGYRIDTASHFASLTPAADPMRDSSFLSLANGGRYAGLTYIPTPGLDVRLGAANWTGRLDDVSMDGAAIGLPGVYDSAHVNSVLAGVTWNFNGWVALGLNGIASFRDGTPFGYQNVAPLTSASATQALQISARFDLGGNWSTSAAFGQGQTRLRSQGGAITSLDAQTYAITVAKRGVFDDGDAMGVSLSRPVPGMAGAFNGMVDSTDDLPPVMAAARAPETDFQVGYVTSFLGGKLALQTNAAYQVNPQGQSGTSAVSVIQRAKIKF